MARNRRGSIEQRENRLKAELAAALKTVNKILKQLELPEVVPPDDDPISACLHCDIGMCPHCGSTELDAGDYDGDSELTCKVVCADCGAEWYEKYRFVGAWWKHRPVAEEDA